MNISPRVVGSVLGIIVLVAAVGSAGCAVEAEGDAPAVAASEAIEGVSEFDVTPAARSGFHDCYLALQVHYSGACTWGYRTPTRTDSYNCSNGYYTETVSFSPVPCSNNPTVPK